MNKPEPAGHGFVLLVAPEREPDAVLAAPGRFLTPAGRTEVRALVGLPLWGHVERLYCGPDTGQHEAAQIIASQNGISVTVVEALAGAASVQRVRAMLRALARHDRGRGAAVVERCIADGLIAGSAGPGAASAGPGQSRLLLFEPGTAAARRLVL